MTTTAWMPSVTLTLLIGATSICQAAAVSNHACVSPSASREKVIATAAELFEALRNDDVERFQKITGPEFYAFDAGKRFNGTELILFIKDAHARGMRFNWSITDPTVHVGCSTAWITYVNKGGIETNEGTQEITWLESMVLEYRQSHWHIEFLQSMRAAK